MWPKLRHHLPSLLAIALVAVSALVLRSELRATDWREISADVLGTPSSRLALALVLTALNYATLTGYDLLAFSYVGKSLPRARITAASALAYAISNSIGLATLSGASVRYRFYTRWGVTASELSRIVVFYSATLWLGLFALGGLSLVIIPWPTTAGWTDRTLATIGWLLIGVPAAYVLTASKRKAPLRLWRFEWALPTPRMAVGQIALSVADWALAGAVFYALLPAARPPFTLCLGAFLLSTLLGLASHVPGGLGVFEGLMLVLLRPAIAPTDLLPSLVVYRAVYYLLPFTMALVALTGDELWQHRTALLRLRDLARQMALHLAPRFLSLVTFGAGVVLLWSGATPAVRARLDVLDRLLPLGVIEASHFLASITGVVLLILAQGLARRLDFAYYATFATLVAGAATSLSKGIDYEEAAVTLVALGALFSARRAFTRRAAFFDTRFSPGWVTAIAGAVLASVWLGVFAYQHVSYSHDLWWQFELRGDASRFLRASVGVALVLLLTTVGRLTGFAPHDAPRPTSQDLDDAARAIAAQSSTYPYLAFLADKALLFNDDRTGFVMYAVQGRTWVALGDPVGPADRHAELVRLFLERCHDYGGTPVFYQVGAAHMHVYADFGLTFAKLGEEARLDLRRFTLNGGHAKGHRQAIKRLAKEGATFRVVAPADVPPLLPELRAVSDEWLASKSTGEKGFSLGFFDEGYLTRFPMAVIEREGRIDAFANLWPSHDRTEISVDLMRYRRDAPIGTMEALFVLLFEWARDQGYATFVLGMAPLAGFERSPFGSLWNRLGTFLYHHGESVYNFQGLRGYKDKFNPEWEPRYLAHPGGPRFARVMADITALVAGGYRRIFLK